MDRCSQNGYSETASQDGSIDSLWAGSVCTDSEEETRNVELLNRRKEDNHSRRRSKVPKSQIRLLRSNKSQTWLPCTRLPLYRSGIMWSFEKKKIPMFIFSPLCIMHKSECVERMGKLFDMSFKFAGTECKLLREILTSHGFRDCSGQGLDYNILWSSNHLKPYHLRLLNELNKVNHFPKSYEITRKDRLAKNIQRMQKVCGLQHFDFVPSSYILPDEFHEFCSGYLQDKAPYIVKPIASSRGRGIYIVSHPEEVPYVEPVIVSRYISNPLLLDGFKFDVRLYVAVTSYEPLLIYIYEEGLVRFATIRYQTGVRHLKSQCMHLTNYSVNKMNFEFVQNDDANVEDFGNKWSLGALLRYLHAEGIDITGLMVRIEDIIIKTFLCVLPPISGACQLFPLCKERCFELYGFDIIIDDNLRPWLLEVNLTPSLACDSPLDFKVKSHMLTDLFNLVGIPCQGSKFSSTNGFNSRIPSTYFTTAEAQVSMTSGLDPPTNAHPRRKTWENRRPAEDHILTETPIDPFLPSPLTEPEIKLVRRIQEEALRSGGWIRLYPDPDAWEQYVFLWPRENSIQVPGQDKDNSVHYSTGFEDNKEESRTFRSAKSLIASAFRSATATLLLQSINTSLSNIESYRKQETINRNFTGGRKCFDMESLKPGSSPASVYYHPNTAPPMVDFRPLLQIPKSERLSGMKRDCTTLAANSKSSQTRLPLHSMTPEQMRNCLICAFGSSTRSISSHQLEQYKYVAGYYAHTLGHMPFFMRKLGDEPYPLTGLCLIPGCSHDGEKTSVSCGIHTKLIRISNELRKPNLNYRSKEPQSSSMSSLTSFAEKTVKIRESQAYLIKQQKTNDLHPIYAGSLTDIQVRHAFMIYLSLVQTRLINESNDHDYHDRLSQSGITSANAKLNLLFRFLVRATSNFSDQSKQTTNGKELREQIRNESYMSKRTILDPRLPMTERKFALAQLLDKFIEVYEYETSIIYCRDSFTVDPELKSFVQSLENLSEAELEELLSNYTCAQKNVDVFLGPLRKSKTRVKISKDRSCKTIKDSRPNSNSQIESPFSSDSGIASSVENSPISHPDQDITISKNDSEFITPSSMQCLIVPKSHDSKAFRWSNSYPGTKSDSDKQVFPKPVQSALNLLKCSKTSCLANSVKNLVSKLKNHELEVSTFNDIDVSDSTIHPETHLIINPNNKVTEKCNQATQITKADSPNAIRNSSIKKAGDRSRSSSSYICPTRRSRSTTFKLVYSTKCTCKHLGKMSSNDHIHSIPNPNVDRKPNFRSHNRDYHVSKSNEHLAYRSGKRCSRKSSRTSRTSIGSKPRHSKCGQTKSINSFNAISTGNMSFDFGFIEPEFHVTTHLSDVE